jgi:hypothetical protein
MPCQSLRTSSLWRATGGNDMETELVAMGLDLREFDGQTAATQRLCFLPIPGSFGGTGKGRLLATPSPAGIRPALKL